MAPAERPPREMLDTVPCCPRCGDEHLYLYHREFRRPVEGKDITWQFWSTCPNTGDPILTGYVSRPEPIPAP